MKFFLLFLIISPAWACSRPSQGLSDKTLCRLSDGKSYDLSFGKGLRLRASELKAELKMVNTSFTHLELSGGELRGDFRDLFGAGKMSDVVFRGADFRFADLRNYSFTEVKFEAARLQGANFKGVDLSRVEFIGCELKDAIFDLRTRLPFSVEEAMEKGMVIK